MTNFKPEDRRPIPWTATTKDLDDLWAGDEEVDPATDEVPDLLTTIFVKQERLMRAVWEKEQANLSVPTDPGDWGNLRRRDIQTRIHETFGHVVRELSEAMANLDSSKTWKDNPRPTDPEAFTEEMADCLHFFVEMCILAGINAEDLFLAYFAKSMKNFKRVDDNY